MKEVGTIGGEVARGNKAARFREIGHAMYGTVWVRPISEALGVSVRSLQRWADGEAPIPEGIWDKVQLLALDCAVELEARARFLRTWESPE